MLWCEKLAEKVSGEQLINDSKTPSGRVHVGSLRGVLIHDAMFRTLKARGIPARYQFGVDDYDPVDELPAGQGEFFEQYLGMPLCNVPAPEGSDAPDMAEHYIRELWDVFRDLGVEAETYRMRDIYRSGGFDEVIDAILKQADVVRRVYREVSHSIRPDNWFPLQVVCEECGRIGTTEVTAYDGAEVEYTCRPDLVEWATGCSHHGKVSPFGGRAKLPWKLEWVAKWATMGITIEGAGKDHNTKGGSRDVSARCLREIFGKPAPLNIPYEFFLVGGAKMSSSRGVGVSAREMADFLPPEVLRFLMIRTPPNRPVNFSPDEKSITKVFNEFDRFHDLTFRKPDAREEDRQVYRLSQITPDDDFAQVNFPLVMALLQLPHLDVYAEVEKRKGGALTAVERRHLDRRLQAARYWLDHYATEEERIRLQDELPDRAAELGPVQRAFLHLLAAALPDAEWEDDALQSTVFDCARSTPIAQPAAFRAIYRVLLDRESGPKAGNLLAFLDRDFVARRFTELPFNAADYRRESADDVAEMEAWLTKQRDSIAAIRVDSESIDSVATVEFTVSSTDGKTHRRRILRPSGEGEEASADAVARPLLERCGLGDRLGDPR